MRNWGIVISAFYVVVVILLFSYGLILLAEAGDVVTGIPESLEEFLQNFLEGVWAPVLILVVGQILLLFLSVDTSWRRMKPQRHAVVTTSLVGLMVAILALSALFAIGVAYSGDTFLEFVFESWTENLPGSSVLSIVLALVFLIWACWGVLFYTFSKRTSNVVDSAVGWLIKGSVLELLIAVPCHLIVRQREQCCAPYMSAFGIATGIAIMLMAFGPSTLFLYQRKLGDYMDKTPDRD